MSGAPAPGHRPEDQFVAARRARLQRLREAGVDPFPARFHRTHTAAAAHRQFERLQAGGTEMR